MVAAIAEGDERTGDGMKDIADAADGMRAQSEQAARALNDQTQDHARDGHGRREHGQADQAHYQGQR